MLLKNAFVDFLSCKLIFQAFTGTVWLTLPCSTVWGTLSENIVSSSRQHFQTEHFIVSVLEILGMMPQILYFFYEKYEQMVYSMCFSRWLQEDWFLLWGCSCLSVGWGPRPPQWERPAGPASWSSEAYPGCSLPAPGSKAKIIDKVGQGDECFFYEGGQMAPASTVREASWPSLMVFRGLSRLLTPSTRL